MEGSSVDVKEGDQEGAACNGSSLDTGVDQFHLECRHKHVADCSTSTRC